MALLLPTISIIAGLVVLIWSADRFVDGALAVAKHLEISPLLIGMLVMGFGTSAPEMLVSAVSAWSGKPELAIGNAYGSNIANIALVLGMTAIISPISVKSTMLRKELPILSAVTLLAGYLLIDGNISRIDALILAVVFGLFVGWSIWESKRKKQNELENIDLSCIEEINKNHLSLSMGIFWIVFGLILLMVSSKALVNGATVIAYSFHISDLVIGLTIVAIGTSLPELAASIAAARKNEHEMALGNVIGSNMFNTLMVVAIAGLIKPMPYLSHEVISRDFPILLTLTFSLFVFGYGYKKNGTINRYEGIILVSVFIGYMVLLFNQAHYGVKVAN